MSIKRNENESFADYKKRRAALQAIQKRKLKHGRIAWYSVKGNAKSTYVRKFHGDLI